MRRPTARSRALRDAAAVETVVQDVRYGARLLARAPAFAAVAILSLAVGIGATAAVFSLADAVLVRTLPVRDPGSLVVVRWTSGPVPPYGSLNGWADDTDTGFASTSFSYAAYRAFESDARRDLDVLGFADLYQVNVVVDGRAEIATAHAVSGSYFDVLGIGAADGRPLVASDDEPGAEPAAVVSAAFARRRFAGGGVGRAVLINSVPFTIVGVLPAGFHGTGQTGTNPDLYVPLDLKARVVPNDDPPSNPNFWWVLAMGRLKPGVSRQQARDALDVLLKRSVAAAKPTLAAKDLPAIALLPGGRGQIEERQAMESPLLTLGLVTMIVLLVACTNVAGLLLARGRARGRELSIRIAIGAPRRRIVRQLLTETLLIAGAGGALGVLVARWLGAALAPALYTGPQPIDVLGGIDGRVLLFVTAVAFAAAIASGLLPAMRATRLNVSSGLQEAARSAVAGRRRGWLAGGLTVAQIALALLLVAGAGLLVRSLGNLEREDLGFDPANLLVFRVDPSSNGYDDARDAALYKDVLDRLRAAPGVQSASLSSHLLISSSASIAAARRLDETAPAAGTSAAWTFERTHQSWILITDAAFFRTLGIPVLRGRTFMAADAGGAPVAIVNRALARQLFGSGDVIRSQFRRATMRGAAPPPLTIIGLVDDAKYASVRDPKPPTMYLYYRQTALKSAPTFTARTAGPPATLAGTARDIVRAIDPTLPVFGVRTERDQIAASLTQERLFARLATLLGAIALGLSAIGLYGLLAYGVARRTREIGLRMALGAGRGRVHWMILRESLVLAALGVAAGVPLAVAGTKVLRAMLFGLGARDPATLAGASLLIVVLAAAAGYVPARRAARVDPLGALRAE